MTAPEFVRQLEGDGFHLREKGGNLVINPARNVTATMKQTLSAMGRDILVYLQDRKRSVAGVSLWRLDRVVEFKTRWSKDSLFISPGPEFTRQLRAEGVAAGRVWDTAELLDLLLTHVSRDDARKIGLAKLAFDAEVVGAKETSE